ncbi:MAG: 50S ribosomal protein L33 [Actinomycetota bacterium]|jgi:large subunit ribosomal protein L33|uniref:50S ribosomal protein L33 n=1 Tax=Euzebya TaxID=908623 RepID=UPI000D3ED9D5|nr:50S ribosomal protein L33 [Euzebya rosea]
MARNDNRIKVKLRSSAGTGFTYMTTKNKSTQRERITMKKYDPVIRKHVDFKEEK